MENDTSSSSSNSKVLDARGRKRRKRRSRTVCQRCHEKKIRCDLELLSWLPLQFRPCSTCAELGTTCTFRPSNKGRRPKRDGKILVGGRGGSDGGGETALIEDARDFMGNDSLATDVATSLGGGNRSCVNKDCLPGDDKYGGHDGSQAIDKIPPALQQSNLETFQEMGYAWFPIVDDEAGTVLATAEATLLRHAVAHFAGHIRATPTPHAFKHEHYQRARFLFYSSNMATPLDRIRAATLLHWCSSSTPGAPTLDSNFWWLGLAIRLAQELGLHREPKISDQDASIKRRIWWTLYTRERLAAICQGRPCIIDEDYCDVRQPTLTDFPSTKTRQAQIFTSWVQLSMIMSRVNKHLFLSRLNGITAPTIPIAHQLTEWIDSTHPLTALPISQERTAPFDRDTHILYLPYLTTISVVYLNTSKNRLPQASVPAVIAASCVARIFEDFLARGPLRFISEQSGWFIAIAILSLLRVRSLPFLHKEAMAHIELLHTALKHTATIWPSAKSLDAGIERILGSTTSISQNNPKQAKSSSRKSTTPQQGSPPSFLKELCAGDGVRWARFFPFVTTKTSPLVDIILTECRHSFPELWPDTDWDWTSQFNELLEGYGSLPVEEAFAFST